MPDACGAGPLSFARVGVSVLGLGRQSGLANAGTYKIGFRFLHSRNSQHTVFLQLLASILPRSYNQRN